MNSLNFLRDLRPSGLRRATSWFSARIVRFVRALPEPADALRFARWLIPCCIVIGLVAEPLAIRFLPI